MLLRCESLEPPMSQMGQPRPSQDFCGTAALPLKPDIAPRGWDGRKVPLPDSCTAASAFSIWMFCPIARDRFLHVGDVTDW
jgi:hypothetical protein